MAKSMSQYFRLIELNIFIFILVFFYFTFLQVEVKPKNSFGICKMTQIPGFQMSFDIVMKYLMQFNDDFKRDR